jgi:hypothetical protein
VIVTALAGYFCRPFGRAGRCVPGPAEEPQPGTLADRRARRAAQRAAFKDVEKVLIESACWPVSCFG